MLWYSWRGEYFWGLRIRSKSLCLSFQGGQNFCVYLGLLAPHISAVSTVQNWSLASTDPSYPRNSKCPPLLPLPSFSYVSWYILILKIREAEPWDIFAPLRRLVYFVHSWFGQNHRPGNLSMLPSCRDWVHFAHQKPRLAFSQHIDNSSYFPGRQGRDSFCMPNHDRRSWKQIQPCCKELGIQVRIYRQH